MRVAYYPGWYCKDLVSVCLSKTVHSSSHLVHVGSVMVGATSKTTTTGVLCNPSQYLNQKLMSFSLVFPQDLEVEDRFISGVRVD